MKKLSDKSQKISVAVAAFQSKLEKELAETPAIVEEEGGFSPLLGKLVLIMCAGYFYVGKLSGVNATCVELTDAFIQYEADDCTPAKMATKLRQKLPAKTWNIQLNAVESFGALE